MNGLHFEACDPETTPAIELLAEMRDELNQVYGAFDRLDNPKLEPDELRPPSGGYLVGYVGAEAVAGGGVRFLADGLGEIKRMFVRPAARSQGVAGDLLSALEDLAVTRGYAAVRLDTGPKQPHAMTLYRRAGYADIERYNENPFACFWGEKDLRPN
ncbi:MAG TPA: GNAT family N-acetyltransferase [Acidimicrobiales bacterium]